MTIQRYEIDIERDEDEQGNPESILAPYRHDKGDWCKAEDVDALEAENAEQAAEIERLNKRFKLLQHASINMTDGTFGTQNITLIGDGLREALWGDKQ